MRRGAAGLALLALLCGSACSRAGFSLHADAAPTGTCDPGCKAGSLCVGGACATDADGDKVAAGMDCDDSDPLVGSRATRDCASACAPGTELCVDGVWAACSAPTNCTCKPGDSRSLPCTRCGTQKQTCTAGGGWVDDGACSGQGECQPNATTRLGWCGRCGRSVQTCSQSCKLGAPTCQGSGQCAPGDWFDVGWQYRRKLTFNNASHAQLADVPVLVVLDSARIDFSQLSSAAADLRFVDSDSQTVLAHEVELLSLSDKKAYIWVKVPLIDASSASDHIWMYWGNANATPGASGTQVWSNNYLAVYHLSGDSVTDSTQKHPNARVTGTQPGPGVAGEARAFSGSDLIDTGVAVNVGPQQNITLSGWANFAQVTGADVIASAQTSAANALSGELRIALSDTAQDGVYDHVVGTLQPNGGATFAAQVAIGGTVTDWRYVVLLREGMRAELYVDGRMVHSGAVADAPIVLAQSLLIGAAWALPPAPPTETRDHAHGRIDEVRLSSVARSINWVAVQYLIGRDAYVTYGALETLTSVPAP